MKSCFMPYVNNNFDFINFFNNQQLDESFMKSVQLICSAKRVIVKSWIGCIVFTVKHNNSNC